MSVQGIYTLHGQVKGTVVARPTRLTIAKKDIFSLFEGSSQKVYSQTELAKILNENRLFWRLSAHTTARDFIAFLEKQGNLEANTFQAAKYHRKIIRYSWGNVSIYQLAQSLQSRGYLSHATAVALHGLTDLIPKTLYLNVEQSAKPSYPGSLTQQGINQAFSRKQRQSNMTYDHDGWSITIINGKNTAALGVEELIGPSEEKLRVTNLERTLIDIVVRPTYAGGVFQVLEAYRAAKDKVSTNRLVATLKKLDYAYPYHQAIGFLMERAGYGERRYTLLRQLGLEYDFYLAHGIREPQYSSEWRLFYPKGMES
jgi:predicted transcriptional regulator of viral defense system